MKLFTTFYSSVMRLASMAYVYLSLFPSSALISRHECMLLAIEQNKPEVLLLLIKMGTSPNSGYNIDIPLVIAILCHNKLIAQILLNQNPSADIKYDALNEAITRNPARGDYIDIINMLIRESPEIDSKHKYSLLASAMHMALDSEYPSPWLDNIEQAIRDLTEAGADISSELPDNQMTVLWWAVNNNKLDLIRFLLQKSAYTRSKFCGNTCLTNAIFHERDIEILRCLIGHDPALVDFQAEWGYPLEIAIRRNRPDMVKILVEAGANIEIKNEKGVALLEWAKLSANPEIIQILTDARSSNDKNQA